MQMNIKPLQVDAKPPAQEVQSIVAPRSAAYRSTVGSPPGQWFGAMINAFVDVVEPTVARFSRRKRWIVVETGQDDLAFYRVSGSRTQLIGQASTLDDRARRMLQSEKGSEIELRLLPARVTQTTLKVPASGLDYIQQIVDSRLDRLTPWKPEKVLYGFAPAAKAGPDGQVDVRFAATSLDIGASSIRRLDAFGLVPSTMGSAAEPLNQRLGIDLFRGKNDIMRRQRRRRIALFTVIASALTLVVYGLTTYAAWTSNQALSALDDDVSAARRKLVQGSGNTADRQKALALINAKVQRNARFVLIDRLADIIPANTFLNELDIQPGILRIAGTSTEASALIQILEAEPALSDAKFSAPVTREADGRDRFDITATLVPQTVEAPQ